MTDRRQGGFLIARIHQTAGRIFARMLKAENIEFNPAQGRILFVLWEQDRIPIGELARRTSLRKSTLTSMLDRLERAGHLQRIPSPHDRRQVLIERTAEDRAWEKRYLRVSKEMTMLFYRGLSKVEIERFEWTLERILENLTRAEGNGQEVSGP